MKDEEGNDDPCGYNYPLSFLRFDAEVNDVGDEQIGGVSKIVAEYGGVGIPGGIVVRIVQKQWMKDGLHHVVCFCRKILMTMLIPQKDRNGGGEKTEHMSKDGAENVCAVDVQREGDDQQEQ